MEVFESYRPERDIGRQGHRSIEGKGQGPSELLTLDKKSKSSEVSLLAFLCQLLLAYCHFLEKT